MTVAIDKRALRAGGVSTVAATRVLLPVFAFPAWSVSVNNQPAEHGVDAATGVISVEVPAGRSLITLQWKALWQERVGAAVSALSLLAFLGIAALRLWRNRPAT